MLLEQENDYNYPKNKQSLEKEKKIEQDIFNAIT
mgnify:CR=1 FL=1